MIDPCYVYEPDFIDRAARAEIEAWLATLVPLWEMRYSTKRAPPSGKQQRPLLRPVYWLGNWQFACLGYYEPPRRTLDAAVAAEPFPPVLARLVAQIEKRVRTGGASSWPRRTNWNRARSPSDSDATGPGSKSRCSPTRAASLLSRVP